MGFAGLVDGSILKAAPWVDLKKPPGYTSMADQLCYQPWNLVRVFFMSGNVVWFAITVFVYFMFPYDFHGAAKGFNTQWILDRLVVNLGVVYSFFGFWHIVTNFFAKRKFAPDTYPSLATMFQDIWYTTLGTAQWTVWEYAYCNIVAKGYLPVYSDGALLEDPLALAVNVFWILLVPAWRDVHFYFAHRFIHYRALYKYIHSLHHRNVDIEPFAGMCMHPFEHLYYFGAIGPSLYLKLSPLVFLWNGVHLLLAPAAGHSGWEDHWLGDQYHYIHHSKFECNYGSPTYCLDQIFGTFREALGTSESYKGEWKAEAQSPKGGAKEKSKYLQIDSGLLNFFPTKVDQVVFWVYTVASFGWVYASAVGEDPLEADPRVIAFNATFGPIFVGILLMKLTADRQSVFWPFQKEPLFGALGIHLVCSFFMALLPCYHIIAGWLGTRHDSGYCLLWNC